MDGQILKVPAGSIEEVKQFFADNLPDQAVLDIVREHGGVNIENDEDFAILAQKMRLPKDWAAYRLGLMYDQVDPMGKSS